MGRYRTIVADPPWDYSEGWPVGRKPQGVNHDGRRSPLGYASIRVRRRRTVANRCDRCGRFTNSPCGCQDTEERCERCGGTGEFVDQPKGEAAQVIRFKPCPDCTQGGGAE